MNMTTHELDSDDFCSALANMMRAEKRAERRRRVRRVRRRLWLKAWRPAITSPMGCACIGIWAFAVVIEVLKRIGGAP
jgi:hypothetical protein